MQTIAQDRLGARLRHHPEVWIWGALGRRFRGAQRARAHRKRAQVNAHLRIESPDGEDLFDDPEVLEDLERSRLQALAARAGEGRLRGLDQAAGYSPA